MKPEPGPRITMAHPVITQGRCSMAGRSSDTAVLVSSILTVPMNERWHRLTETTKPYGRSVIGNTVDSKSAFAGSSPVAHDRNKR